MSNLESADLAINDIYKRYSSNKVGEVYRRLYKVPSEVTSNLDKILFLFATFHETLNELLTEVNFKSKNWEPLSADTVCDLFRLSKSVADLQSNTQGTFYYFHVSREYWLFLYKVPSNFTLGREAYVPNGFGEVSLQEYQTIFWFMNNPSAGIEPEKPIADVIQLISTRNAEFETMGKDEKLSVLNQAVEYYLKKGKEYIQFDQYGSVFCGLICEDALKDYRKATHCFRHGKQEDIAKRAAYSDAQKDFLVDFGVSICNAIGSQKAK